MYPILYEYNNLVITSFGVCLTVAFIAFVFVVVKLAPKRNVNISFFGNNLLWFFLFTFLGTKVLYWIFNFSDIYDDVITRFEVQDYFAIFRILFNAEQFYTFGGVLAFAFIFFILARKYKESILEWIDIFLPATGLAVAIGSIGAFLGGYYVGAPTTSFFGIKFPSDTRFSIASHYTIPIHPVQIYTFVISIIILFVLIEMIRKVHTKGVVGVVGIILLSLSTFIIEFFRGLDNMFRFGLTLNQYLCLIFIIFGIYLFMKRVPRITQ